MKKINSNGWGGKVIAAGLLIGAAIPAAVWIVFRVFLPGFCVAGGAVLAAMLLILLIERRQDNAPVPYFERTLSRDVPFDAETQEAVVRSSICTGEKVAGFRDKNGARFVEVMVIRNADDLKRFKSMYGLDEIKTEY